MLGRFGLEGNLKVDVGVVWMIIIESWMGNEGRQNIEY